MLTIRNRHGEQGIRRKAPAVLCSALLLAAAGLAGRPSVAAEPARKWLKSTAYVVPKETAPEGEGYFSIIEGHNGRFYIGTHANAVNSWLVEFDPKAKAMKVVVDTHK